MKKLILAGLLFMSCVVAVYAQGQSGYIIVHCHNPEGKEIASIEGMQTGCVRIYSDGTQIGYGVDSLERHNKPIVISAGGHRIKAEFNGMIKEDAVTLNPEETKAVTFVFEREEVNLNQILNKEISSSASASHEVYHNYFEYSHVDLFFGESSSPGCWIERWKHEYCPTSDNHIKENHVIVHGEFAEPSDPGYDQPWLDPIHWTAGFWVSCEFDCDYTPWNIAQTFSLNASCSLSLTPGSFRGDFSYSHNGDNYPYEGNRIVVKSVEAQIGIPLGYINLSPASFINSNIQEWYIQGIIPDYTGDYAPVTLYRKVRNSWDEQVIIPGSIGHSSKFLYPAQQGYWFNKILANPSPSYSFLFVNSIKRYFPFKVSIFTGFKFSSVPYDLTGTAVGDEDIPNVKPQAEITAISPNPAESGGTITFQGKGRDSDGVVAGYTWRSSLDGQLGQADEFKTSGLSQGTHRIYFKVKDNEGAWSDEVSAVLVINSGGSLSGADTGYGKNRYDDENEVGEPVNIVNGNMYTIAEDLSFAGCGIGIDFQRCYNSQKAYSGPLGYGWTHSYNIFLEDLEIGGTKIRITQEDGRAIYFSRQADGSYAAPKGEYSRLNRGSKGYVWRLKNGVTYYFNFDFYSSDLSEKPASLSEDIYYLYIPVSIIEDRNHNHIRLTYKAYNLIAITDSAGRELTFTYSGSRLAQITDPAGSTLKYSYDTAGNLREVTGLAGESTVYEYDAEHNLTKIIDANGNAVYFEYDAQDRCTANYYDNNTLRRDIAYDADNRKTTITDSRDAQTIKTYNTDGLVTQVQEADGKSRFYTWDADYNRSSIKDKNGNLTLMSYDRQGNLIGITDAKNNTTTFEYEPEYSFMSKTTDCQGNSTVYTYDTQGNQTSITNALGAISRYSYDNFGRVIAYEDSQGNITSYAYDKYGNLILTIDNKGNQTRSDYDILGRCISVTDARGNTTNYAFDQAGNVKRIIYPDASFVEYSYDDKGNRKSITDANGNTIRFEYTATDKLAKSIDALGREITYTYDREENLIHLTDSQGNTTEYSYDGLNRLIEEKNPLGITTVYQYDQAGNKTAVTDGKGQTIHYEYDSLNRLFKIIYPDEKSVSYSYDDLSRQTAVEDDAGKTVYRYDKIGQLIEISGPGEDETLSYEYDSLGRRVKMIDQDKGISEYAYTELNQLESLSNPQKQKTSFSYDEIGNLDLVTYPNGMQADYNFDRMNRLESLVNRTPAGEVISSYSYSYDCAGRRIKAVLSDGEIIYTYDNANQLIEEQRIGEKVSYSNSYSYDLAGNRTRKGSAEETTDYSYDSFNRLLRQTSSNYRGGNKVFISGEVDALDTERVFVNGIPAKINKGIFTAKVPLLPGENSVLAQAFDKAGNSTQATLRMNLDPVLEAAYTYDNNGNRIQKSFRGEQTVYSYDYDNQLNRIIYPDGDSIQYTYDAAGRRISEESFSGESPAAKQYFYDGNTVIIERDGTGKTTATYTRGVSIGGGIGGIISRTTQDARRTTHYYLYDGQGNVTQLTNSTAKVIISYDYDAFGNVMHQNGSLENNCQFQTKEYAQDSGLVYFGARYYDPQLGRWLTPDPLGMADGPNRYLYCSNNPIGWIDPWGLCKEDDSQWEELEYWFDKILNTLDDISTSLSMNPAADGMPGIPLDQGLGIIGVGVVKGTRAVKVVSKKIFVIGEAVGTNRVKDAAIKIGGKFYEAQKTIKETGLAKALRNNYQAMRRKFLQGYKLKDMGLHHKPELRGKGYFYKWEQKWKKLWGWE